MTLSDLAKNSMLQGLANLLNSGTGCVLSIYIDEELAAEISLPSPVEADTTEGVLNFKPSAEAIVLVSGVPTSVQLRDSYGEFVAQYLGSELVLSANPIEQGNYININSLSIRI